MTEDCNNRDWQLWIAEQLPDVIELFDSSTTVNGSRFLWVDHDYGIEVHESAWDRLIRLVEESLTDEEFSDYVFKLAVISMREKARLLTLPNSVKAATLRAVKGKVQ